MNCPAAATATSERTANLARPGGGGKAQHREVKRVKANGSAKESESESRRTLSAWPPRTPTTLNTSARTAGLKSNPRSRRGRRRQAHYRARDGAAQHRLTSDGNRTRPHAHRMRSHIATDLMPVAGTAAHAAHRSMGIIVFGSGVSNRSTAICQACCNLINQPASQHTVLPWAGARAACIVVSLQPLRGRARDESGTAVTRAPFYERRCQGQACSRTNGHHITSAQAEASSTARACRQARSRASSS